MESRQRSELGVLSDLFWQALATYEACLNNQIHTDQINFHKCGRVRQECRSFADQLLQASLDSLAAGRTVFITKRATGEITNPDATEEDIIRLHKDNLGAITLAEARVTGDAYKSLRVSLIFLLGTRMSRRNVDLLIEQCRICAKRNLEAGLELITSGFISGISQSVPRKEYENRVAELEFLRGYLENPSKGLPISIPGGSLEANENIEAGRHFLTRHVFMSENDAWKELEERKSSKLSLIPKTKAEWAVPRLLLICQTDIYRWLAGRKKTIPIPRESSIDFGEPLGKLFKLDENGLRKTVSSSKLHLILTRDPDSPTGYWIKTGYLQE